MVALLRAVNVGGTGKLAMTDLVAVCQDAGFGAVRTYIASGNVVFTSGSSASDIKAGLEARLERLLGRSVGVIVRTGTDIADVLARNPFAAAPGNRVMAIFLDRDTSPTDLTGVTGQGPDEAILLGAREIYVRYGAGMGRSRLHIPAAHAGTARNMNTVARLAAMAAG